MTSRTRIKVSISLLVVFMTVGFILLLAVYTGPRWIALVVFLVYVFILRFLFFSVGRLLKAMKEVEQEKTEE